jgi:hypothetical protein
VINPVHDNHRRSPLGLLIIAACIATGLFFLRLGLSNIEQSAPFFSGNPRNPGRPHSAWGPATSADRASGIRTVSGQLTALERHNYYVATSYQSVPFQQICMSIPRFQHMIEVNYPVFADHAAVKFGPAEESSSGRELALQIVLIGRQEQKVPAIYELIRENGYWRVNGVEGGRAQPGFLARGGAGVQNAPIHSRDQRRE